MEQLHTARFRSCLSSRLSSLAVVLCGLLVGAVPASAQLSRASASTVVVVPLPFFVNNSDIGYDPVHNIYLVVGAHGPLFAVFANSSGAAISSPFLLHAFNGSGPFAQSPRVKYSQDINNGGGGFLVTWHQNDSGVTNFVHTRIVAYPDGAITNETVLPSAPTLWTVGAAIAYSATSKEFYVVSQAGQGGAS